MNEFSELVDDVGDDVEASPESELLQHVLRHPSTVPQTVNRKNEENRKRQSKRRGEYGKSINMIEARNINAEERSNSSASDTTVRRSNPSIASIKRNGYKPITGKPSKGFLPVHGTKILRGNGTRSYTRKGRLRQIMASKKRAHYTNRPKTTTNSTQSPSEATVIDLCGDDDTVEEKHTTQNDDSTNLIEAIHNDPSDIIEKKKRERSQKTAGQQQMSHSEYFTNAVKKIKKSSSTEYEFQGSDSEEEQSQQQALYTDAMRMTKTFLQDGTQTVGQALKFARESIDSIGKTITSKTSSPPEIIEIDSDNPSDSERKKRSRGQNESTKARSKTESKTGTLVKSTGTKRSLVKHSTQENINEESEYDSDEDIPLHTQTQHNRRRRPRKRKAIKARKSSYGTSLLQDETKKRQRVNKSSTTKQLPMLLSPKSPLYLSLHSIYYENTEFDKSNNDCYNLSASNNELVMKEGDLKNQVMDTENQNQTHTSGTRVCEMLRFDPLNLPRLCLTFASATQKQSSEGTTHSPIDNPKQQRIDNYLDHGSRGVGKIYICPSHGNEARQCMLIDSSDSQVLDFDILWDLKEDIDEIQIEETENQIEETEIQIEETEIQIQDSERQVEDSERQVDNFGTCERGGKHQYQFDLSLCSSHETDPSVSLITIWNDLKQYRNTNVRSTQKPTSTEFKTKLVLNCHRISSKDKLILDDLLPKIKRSVLDTTKGAQEDFVHTQSKNDHLTTNKASVLKKDNNTDHSKTNTSKVMMYDNENEKIPKGKKEGVAKKLRKFGKIGQKYGFKQKSATSKDPHQQDIRDWGQDLDSTHYNSTLTTANRNDSNLCHLQNLHHNDGVSSEISQSQKRNNNNINNKRRRDSRSKGDEEDEWIPELDSGGDTHLMEHLKLDQLLTNEPRRRSKRINTRSRTSTRRQRGLDLDGEGMDDVLCVYPDRKQKTGVTIRRADLERLNRHYEYLNDTLIDFALLQFKINLRRTEDVQIQKKEKDTGQIMDPNTFRFSDWVNENVHIFSCFLFKQLLRHRDVRRQLLKTRRRIERRIQNTKDNISTEKKRLRQVADRIRSETIKTLMLTNTKAKTFPAQVTSNDKKEDVRNTGQLGDVRSTGELGSDNERKTHDGGSLMNAANDDIIETSALVQKNVNSNPSDFPPETRAKLSVLNSKQLIEYQAKLKSLRLTCKELTSKEQDMDGDAIVYEQVRTWTRRTDIFAKEYVFIPVNDASHWSLLVVAHMGKLINEVAIPCVIEILQQCQSKYNEVADNSSTTQDDVHADIAEQLLGEHYQKIIDKNIGCLSPDKQDIIPWPTTSKKKIQEPLESEDDGNEDTSNEPIDLTQPEDNIGTDHNEKKKTNVGENDIPLSESQTSNTRLNKSGNQQGLFQKIGTTVRGIFDFFTPNNNTNDAKHDKKLPCLIFLDSLSVHSKEKITRRIRKYLFLEFLHRKVLPVLHFRDVYLGKVEKSFGRKQRDLSAKPWDIKSNWFEHTSITTVRQTLAKNIIKFSEKQNKEIEKEREEKRLAKEREKATTKALENNTSTMNHHEMNSHSSPKSSTPKTLTRTQSSQNSNGGDDCYIVDESGIAQSPRRRRAVIDDENREYELIYKQHVQDLFYAEELINREMKEKQKQEAIQKQIEIESERKKSFLSRFDNDNDVVNVSKSNSDDMSGKNTGDMS
eukprot:g3179.t1